MVYILILRVDLAFASLWEDTAMINLLLENRAVIVHQE